MQVNFWYFCEMKPARTPIILWFFVSLTSNAQISKIEYYNDIDNKVVVYSKKKDQNMDSVIRYVNNNFKSKEDKIRAYHTWIALNVKYDTERPKFFGEGISRYAQSAVFAPGQDVDSVFKNKMAVCEGFSDLMVKLCSGSAIKCKRVIGYSKTPEGKVLTESMHVWNVVKADSVYCLLDITWSNGYLNGEGKYVKRFSDKYFFASPEVFGKDHYPVDPRWQLVDYPISFNSFKQDTVLTSKKLYNYSDSIEAYFKLSVEEQDLLDYQLMYLSDPTDSLLAHDLDVKVNNAALKQINSGKYHYDEYAAYNNNILRINMTGTNIKQARLKLTDSKKRYIKARNILKNRKGRTIYYKNEFEKMDMHIDICLMEIEQQYIRLVKLEKTQKKK